MAAKVKEYSGYALTLKDKEFIYEVHKSMYDDAGKLIREEIENIRRKQEISTDSKSVRSNSSVAKKLSYQDINLKYVMLNRLEAARNMVNQRKIQQLIDMEEDEALMAEMIKNKGLIQIDHDHLVSIAMTNLKNCKDVWRTIR